MKKIILGIAGVGTGALALTAGYLVGKTHAESELEAELLEMETELCRSKIENHRKALVIHNLNKRLKTKEEVKNTTKSRITPEDVFNLLFKDCDTEKFNKEAVTKLIEFIMKINVNQDWNGFNSNILTIVKHSPNDFVKTFYVSADTFVKTYDMSEKTFFNIYNELKVRLYSYFGNK